MSTVDAPSPEDLALRDAIRARLVAALERPDLPPDGLTAAHLDRIVEGLAAMSADPERRANAVATGSDVLADYMERLQFRRAAPEVIRPIRDAGALLAWTLASLDDFEELTRLREERARFILANDEVARMNVDLQCELAQLRAQLAATASPGDAP